MVKGNFAECAGCIFCPDQVTIRDLSKADKPIQEIKTIKGCDFSQKYVDKHTVGGTCGLYKNREEVENAE